MSDREILRRMSYELKTKNSRVKCYAYKMDKKLESAFENSQTGTGPGPKIEEGHNV